MSDTPLFGRGKPPLGKHDKRDQGDGLTRLESAAREYQKRRDFAKQHGPVRVIVKDGVPLIHGERPESADVQTSGDVANTKAF